jgi:hypothetical protein
MSTPRTCRTAGADVRSVRSVRVDADLQVAAVQCQPCAPLGRQLHGQRAEVERLGGGGMSGAGEQLQLLDGGLQAVGVGQGRQQHRPGVLVALLQRGLHA